MTTTAQATANEFIRLAQDDGRAFTPLQLIKLVYIAHGWMLGIHGRPLIRDRIEAWKYGPVIPSLYHDLKKYGADYVQEELPIFTIPSPSINEEERDLISAIFNAYGRMTGIALSSLTHQPGTPWHDTWNPASLGLVIPNDLIAEHYRRLARDRGVIKD